MFVEIVKFPGAAESRMVVIICQWMKKGGVFIGAHKISCRKEGQ